MDWTANAFAGECFASFRVLSKKNFRGRQHRPCCSAVAVVGVAALLEWRAFAARCSNRRSWRAVEVVKGLPGRESREPVRV